MTEKFENTKYNFNLDNVDVTFTEDRESKGVKPKPTEEKSNPIKDFLYSVIGRTPTFSAQLLTDEEYCKMGKACENECLKLLVDTRWKKEKSGVLPGDIVEILQHEKFGKLYRGTGVVDCPPDFLFKEMGERLANVPNWNPIMIKLNILKELDKHTSLVYQVTGGGPKGVVKLRDFVCICRIDEPALCKLVCAVSVELPQFPPTDEYIRAQNNLSCWGMFPIEGQPKKCRFQWIMGCDLKGWLPSSVLDIIFPSAQLEYLENIRKHVATQAAGGAF